MASEAPSVVRSTERHAATGLPRGVLGEEAFHHGRSWVGFLRLSPGAASGWHHHGGYDSYAYVIAGVLRWEHGEDGGDATEVGAGDTGHLPPKLVHRDVSVGEEDLVMILFRAGTDRELTIDVPGPATRREALR